MSFLNPTKLLQTTAVFLVQFFLCLGLVCASSGIPAASASPLRQVNYWIAQAATESLDVDRAADKADAASENIYKGLDTTKRVVGKTDKRNQVIEQAREKGSEKWKALADKAKAAQNSETDLNLTDKKVLRQVQD